MVKTVLVRADNSLRTAVDTRLSTCRGLLNTHLRHARFNSLSHASELFYFLNVLPSLMRQLVGKCLNIVRTGPRVNVFAYLCLVLNINLSVTCNTSGEVGR